MIVQWFARHSIYPAFSDLEETPGDYGCYYEDVHFASRDGCRLHGWWIPHSQPRANVLLCHANGENVGSWAGVAAWYRELPCNFLLFDYRGYGRSEGRPHEAGLYADSLAAHDWLVGHHGASLPIVVWGRSLGSAVAVHLAARRDVGGLVIESGFTSMLELASQVSAFPGFLLRMALRNERFDALGKIASVRCPKLIAHSPDDDLIPFEMARRMYAAASEPKAFCELQGGHNEPAFEQPDYHLALLSLVGQASAGRQRSDSSPRS